MDNDVFQSVDPCTGKVLSTHPELTAAELEAALEQGVRAQNAWRAVPVARRAGTLRELANLLRQRTDPYARRIAREMGKVMSEGRAEIEKSALACDHYAENAETYLRRATVATEARASYVEILPLGIVLAIMPWNFPFWQVLRFAIPALLSGNGVLLKHATNVLECAADLEQLFRDAGFPEGLFRSIVIGIPQVGALIEDPRVAAVTLTGSVASGRAVAALAGHALKKCVLELGGSDPFIVLGDADIERAAGAAVSSRFHNCGQSCIAAKRFIVVESVREEFEQRFIAGAAALRVGDPRMGDIDLGPMARFDLRDRLHRQLEQLLADGAALRLGGRLPAGAGAFFPPTLVVRQPQGSTVEEEIFGPLAVVIPVLDESEAVGVANQTAFGLSGSVWTWDIARGERVAAAVASGSFFVNRVPFSDPRLPFGGIGQSGYGRELADSGVREFANIRSVWIDEAGTV